MQTKILRTPDERFANLPGYDFPPNYAQVGADQALRMHYVAAGPADGPLVLLLHGEPSWSYLYRKMIPVFAEAGCRVIAPDLIGFGKSDKPADIDVYTYQQHLDWLRELLFDRLDLKDITLFCQDWGGLLGLRLVAEHPDRFARVAAGNTFLPTGDQAPGEDFLKWQNFSQKTKRLPVAKIIKSSCVTPLSDDVLAAYGAPFPEEEYKAAARKFPALVPVSPDDPAAEPNRKAWESLKKFEKPFLCCFSDSDPITRGGDVVFRRYIPGAKQQPHTTIQQAGHFLQEDKGEEIASYVLKWMRGEL